MSQQEDDLRALAKIMDFLRAVSIILVVMNVYWFCYEAIRLWGIDIRVADRILVNFNRTAGLFRSVLYTKLFAVLLLTLSCLAQDMDGSCRRLCAVFPELVDTGASVSCRDGRSSVYPYPFGRIYLSADGRTVDVTPAEAQSHGRCVQQREREFHAGNPPAGE